MISYLVTAIGSFAGEVVISGLKKLRAKIVTCDIYPKNWIVNANDADCFYQVPKANKTGDYKEAIVAICEKEKIEKIIPLTDIEIDFFNNTRDVFEDKGAQVLMSPKEVIDICRNKEKMYKFINDKKIKVNCIPEMDLKKVSKADFPLV